MYIKHIKIKILKKIKIIHTIKGKNKMKNILTHNIIAMSEAYKGWCEANVRGFSFGSEAGFEDIGRS